MNLGEFHFLRPYWFFALIPSFIFLWWLAKRHLVNKQWESVCDPELLPYMLVGKTGRKQYTHVVLIGLTALIMITALAGPTWERLPQPVYQKESALVIALDLSLSMLADDINPSRLEHARFEISDLLDLRKEGQTALLVYAGDAFTVTPLTDDVKTIKSQLSALSPEIMPSPGSNTALALSHAVELLKQGGVSQGDILFVTDEIEQRYEESIKQANKQGYRVSILGVGTKEGAPVRVNGQNFLEDRQGSIVIPKLNKAVLNQLAIAGGGRYETSQIDDGDINRLNKLFTSHFKNDEERKTEFETDRWEEFGPWLVLLVIPIVAFGFRRGVLGIVVCLLIIKPDGAMAFEWDELWLNKDQRAMQALNNDKPDQAAELFNDKDWKAAAKYRAGDYKAAEELLKDNVDERNRYNKANALAKQGRYKEAIAAYDEVLKKNPGHEDAKYNRDIVNKELEKQQQQQKQSQSDQDSDKQDSESDENQQQSESGSESKQDDKQQNSQEQQQQSESQKQQGQQQDEAQQQAESDEQQQEDKAQQQQAQESDEEQQQEEEQQSSAEKMNDLDEEQQASEQWLRRIPDDPSGLLRRKFKYQYQQRGNQRSTDEKYW